MPLTVTGVAAGPSDPQQSNLESISPSQCGINLLVDGNGLVDGKKLHSQLNKTEDACLPFYTKYHRFTQNF